MRPSPGRRDHHHRAHHDHPWRGEEGLGLSRRRRTGAAESTLVFIATTNTPDTLQKAADHAVYLLNQDGASPRSSGTAAGWSSAPRTPTA
jgi:hypothetical protein